MPRILRLTMDRAKDASQEWKHGDGEIERRAEANVDDGLVKIKDKYYHKQKDWYFEEVNSVKNDHYQYHKGNPELCFDDHRVKDVMTVRKDDDEWYCSTFNYPKEMYFTTDDWNPEWINHNNFPGRDAHMYFRAPNSDIKLELRPRSDTYVYFPVGSNYVQKLCRGWDDVLNLNPGVCGRKPEWFNTIRNFVDILMDPLLAHVIRNHVWPIDLLRLDD